MSVTSPKGKKSSPIASFKPGPLKATLPVASLMRTEPDINKCKSNSPTTCLRNRFSPDSPLSGQLSPGFLSTKGLRSRGATNNLSNPYMTNIRRTASLDAIYLKGQWPTEAFYMHLGTLQVDKATQTEEGPNEKSKSRLTESSCDDLRVEKYLRHRLRTGRMQGLGLRLISPPMTDSPPQVATPTTNSPHGQQSPVQAFQLSMLGRQPVTRGPMRGSLEGLNQEIETLVLKDYDEKIVAYGSIPEGHRAPLADILRLTRSVNTQTPGGQDDVDTDFGSSGPPSRGSLSPQYCMEILHTNLNESCGSSPDEGIRPGTSPRINRFLAREPPDGCEKVSMRLEEARRAASVTPVTALKPITTGLFKPSLGSAFQPLQTHADTAIINGECSDTRASGSPSSQQSE